MNSYSAITPDPTPPPSNVGGPAVGNPIHNTNLSQTNLPGAGNTSYGREANARSSDKISNSNIYSNSGAKISPRSATEHPPVSLPIDPPLRSYESDHFPHGVLNGSRVIDMLEHFSNIPYLSAERSAHWLKTHYLDPFQRIERLDGLVVRSAMDASRLWKIYDQYIQAINLATALNETLWMPGFEPIHSYVWPGATNTWITIEGGMSDMKIEPERWTASDMYRKNGEKTKRAGTFVSEGRDARGWMRQIWTAEIKRGRDGESEESEGSGEIRWSDFTRSDCPSPRTGSRSLEQRASRDSAKTRKVEREKSGKSAVEDQEIEEERNEEEQQNPKDHELEDQDLEDEQKTPEDEEPGNEDGGLEWDSPQMQDIIWGDESFPITISSDEDD